MEQEGMCFGRHIGLLVLIGDRQASRPGAKGREVDIHGLGFRVYPRTLRKNQREILCLFFMLRELIQQNANTSSVWVSVVEPHQHWKLI